MLQLEGAQQYRALIFDDNFTISQDTKQGRSQEGRGEGGAISPPFFPEKAKARGSHAKWWVGKGQGLVS